jgi:hypothetical protein
MIWKKIKVKGYQANTRQALRRDILMFTEYGGNRKLIERILDIKNAYDHLFQMKERFRFLFNDLSYEEHKSLIKVNSYR